ncbi:hypothetical protein [Nocardioides sp. GY 10127]|uniref:hypothetical protein n=1 Tax=Nocardioides sp. GY 10127 TaxID=2569762 RepID=UPI0019807214|nr:hypothetical protein [Nocardioides sp. GY 10127]
MPAADDLFRPTAGAVETAPDASATAGQPKDDGKGGRKPTGRVRHDEKMTVYLSSEELMHIEQARLSLRGQHGLGVDRGRLVREAVALVLAEFEERGEDSALVRRLVQE